jgi:hydrogenase maturation protease
VTRRARRSVSCAATADGPATLVVGLGNPILGDDGVGWRVAEELERRLANDPVANRAVGPVEIDRLSVGGLRLMERLVGYDRAVVADASLDGQAPGTVRVGPLSAIDASRAGHLDSAHDATLITALDAGRGLGARLPRELMVVGISVAVADEFADALSPDVAAAVGGAVERIVELLSRGGES